MIPRDRGMDLSVVARGDRRIRLEGLGVGILSKMGDWREWKLGRWVAD